MADRAQDLDAAIPCPGPLPGPLRAPLRRPRMGDVPGDHPLPLPSAVFPFPIQRYLIAVVVVVVVVQRLNRFGSPEWQGFPFDRPFDLSDRIMHYRMENTSRNRAFAIRRGSPSSGWDDPIHSDVVASGTLVARCPTCAWPDAQKCHSSASPSRSISAPRKDAVTPECPGPVWEPELGMPRAPPTGQIPVAFPSKFSPEGLFEGSALSKTPGTQRSGTERTGLARLPRPITKAHPQHLPTRSSLFSRFMLVFPEPKSGFCIIIIIIVADRGKSPQTWTG